MELNLDSIMRAEWKIPSTYVYIGPYSGPKKKKVRDGWSYATHRCSLWIRGDRIWVGDKGWVGGEESPDWFASSPKSPNSVNPGFARAVATGCLLCIASDGIGEKPQLS